MRPEFVRSYSKPLPSLAYSHSGLPAGVSSEKVVMQNREAKEATEHLLSTVCTTFFSFFLNSYFLFFPLKVIPEFVHSLVDIDPNRGDFLLVEAMHRKGIGCRYLGIVRSCYLNHINQSTKSKSGSFSFFLFFSCIYYYYYFFLSFIL